MPASRTSRKNNPAGMTEEIERLQGLLRRLDEKMKAENDVSLRDLAQAVRTAGEGGRSIAQLRKLARQLDSVTLDDEAEQLRVQLFDLLDKLGRHRQETEVR